MAKKITDTVQSQLYFRKEGNSPGMGHRFDFLVIISFIYHA